jgi:hypothetical protein
LDDFLDSGLKSVTGIGNLRRANIVNGNIHVHWVTMNHVFDGGGRRYLFLDGELKSGYAQPSVTIVVK